MLIFNSRVNWQFCLYLKRYVMYKDIHSENQVGKYYFMIDEKNNQLLQEQEAWKRSLEFYKQENALLKYRLSEMVDKSEGDHFLQTAEYFQNEFLIQDEWLQRLAHSLQSIQEEGNIAKQPKLATDKMNSLQEELRNQIGKFEHEFIQLSNDFNKKVIKSIH